jgi:hypothetical protein
MAGIAIGVGIFVFLFTGAFISNVLQNHDAGFFPGLVLSIWAAWPFFHHARVHRVNFLHPVPKEYQVSAKVAFAKVRDFLADTSYKFGDKWHVVTADTQAGRIAASLRFTDEETHLEADARGHIHTRKERVQRFITLDIQVKDTGRGTVVLQLDFCPKVEGANLLACDSIVSTVSGAVESALGAGTQIGDPADTALPAPPWWLIGLSAVALLALLDNVMKAVFQ